MSAKHFPVDGKVFAQEVREVRDRWDAVYGKDQTDRALDAASMSAADAASTPPSDDSEKPRPIPSVDHKLFGLAFSGGGIRSATLNLGIVQALHRRGVFNHVDYMSTVSGGGYLGSSISTLMRKRGEEGKFPFEHPKGPEESEYLTWLRNNSNYLAERGLLDYLRLVAVLVRGVLINFLVLLPVLLAGSLALAIVYEPMLDEWFASEPVLQGFSLTKPVAEPGWLQKVQEWPLNEAPYLFTPWVGIAALVYFLSFPIVTRIFKVVGHEKTASSGSSSTVRGRDLYERTFGGAMLLVGVVAAFETLPLLIHHFHQLHDEGMRGVFASILGGSSIAALSAAGKLVKLFKSLGRTVMIWVVGLLGLILPLLVILYVAELLVYDKSTLLLDERILGVIPVVLALGTLGIMVIRVLKAGFMRALWIVPLLLITVCLCGAVVVFGDTFAISPRWAVAVFLVEVATFTWLAVDINLTAVHGFYRDRLASAYLIGKDEKNKVIIEKDVNLQKLRQPGSRVPYHLINVALNLQGSKDPNIRDRNSDFCIFSKHFFGGPRTGYARTQDLETVFPQMDVATAMAISGAAAAPNMGSLTNPALVALMTLFNIRLGFWTPNPRKLNPWADKQRAAGSDLESSLSARFSWRVRPKSFIQEMFSKLDETGDWINLSDGGHIENLGVYELLRRRCKFIIVGDGGADPEMTFDSLATLQRFARIDMGIEIEMPLKQLDLGDNGYSRLHHAWGRIKYPADKDGGKREVGYLLYLKSSLTDDEDVTIAEYRRRKPEFPHESTADQFFDEGQFEAYRALGFHIADKLFDEVDPRDAPPRLNFEQFQQWFARQEVKEKNQKTEAKPQSEEVPS